MDNTVYLFRFEPQAPQVPATLTLSQVQWHPVALLQSGGTCASTVRADPRSLVMVSLITIIQLPNSM